MIWYSYEQLQRMASGGQLRREMPIYDSPRRRWLRADAIPEVAPYFPRHRFAPAVALTAIGALLLARATEQTRLRRLSWGKLREAIFQRDNHTCTYCGYRGTRRTLEVDHRIPVARGGSDDSANLVTACWSCNREKGTMTEYEYSLLQLIAAVQG